MKFFTLITLAGSLMLGGCASTNESAADKLARTADTNTPTGTLIPRKNANRSAGPTIVDKQALDNERAMGGSNRDASLK